MGQQSAALKSAQELEDKVRSQHQELEAERGTTLALRTKEHENEQLRSEKTIIAAENDKLRHKIADEEWENKRLVSSHMIEKEYYEDLLNKLRREIRGLKDKEHELDRDLDACNDTVGALRKEKYEADRKVAELEVEISKLSKALEDKGPPPSANMLELAKQTQTQITIIENLEVEKLKRGG